MLSKLQMDTLHGIGMIKQFLPWRARGLCNELGLYVQTRSSEGLITVKAGGKFLAKVHIQSDIHSPSYPKWTVKKYKAGDWEALIEPTHQLAAWLYDCSEAGALEQPAVASALRSALDGFRRTGMLELPENPRRRGKEASG